MKIAVIGCGYVGLVTAAGLADFGHTVTGIDIDSGKIDRLRQGLIPVFEKGLAGLVRKNMRARRLYFSNSLKEGISQATAIYIAVGTPSREDGTADLTQVEAVAREIGFNLQNYAVVINKSTVPVGTVKMVRQIIGKSRNSPFDYDVVSNPEFLREGSAVEDFLLPDRVVIGTDSVKAKKIMKEIYQPLLGQNIPFIFTNPETAELIKYAANAFLAAKITFINEIAHLCETAGADVLQVAKGMGLDRRIGPDFLRPGPGYGGSCFPKDTKALVKIAQTYNRHLKIVETVVKVNENHQHTVVGKIKRLLGDPRDKVLAVLGLAFKANTDDIRESPAIIIINELLAAGAKIRVHDPEALSEGAKILGDKVYYSHDEYDAAANADALILLTDWSIYRHLDFERIKQIVKDPLLIDLRNLFNPRKICRYGFKYAGLGRGITFG